MICSNLYLLIIKVDYDFINLRMKTKIKILRLLNTIFFYYLLINIINDKIKNGYKRIKLSFVL